MKKQNDANGSRPTKKVVSQPAKVTIRKLPTGVRGLDDIMGGGIPEFSFNIIAGTPGCGKTTMAHQLVFANATVKKPALYFTVLGESAIKMLRYQQQFSFFDESKLGKAVRFINLSDVVLGKDLDAVLDEIIKQVTTIKPGLVVVDSFRTVVRTAQASSSEIEMQSFIQRLAQFLTSWEATTFLVGEYAQDEIRDNPLFTIVDGLFWLSQVAERNSVVRKLQIMKLRGQASVPGMHTVRINDDGVQAFSRTLGLAGKAMKPVRKRRLSMGIPELDKMMGGGILEGDSLLVAGPSGTGKSALATQFIAEGLRHGEPGIMAIFEERPAGYTHRADSFGLNLRTPQEKGKLEILYLRPLDLSVDETMQEILDAIERIGAKRLVIDSLVGFEMALAPGFRADFRESLYRMIGALTGAGVTILSTVEVEDTFTALSFSHYTISFLTDDILRMRYVEIDGQLRKVMVVIKMRGGNHSKDIREYVITNKGVVVIHPRSTEYIGLTAGIPQRTGPRQTQEEEPAPEPKARK
ncbi:ATPase domain-containing protein [Polaromonas eurypsychrophila]|uniref:non-specific serine/threonine protein kinase n=1 Tax=Polaromonas eurypsychrophila TaxID=1614635 RepID=A0A916WIJ1_9BURK|nr:ATPase domain-containing protein [Polaromonas eurypsychrophila]GGB01066.1 circadian clock protein KaiC [Polaromonas eurypsychrophila]